MTDNAFLLLKSFFKDALQLIIWLLSLLYTFHAVFVCCFCTFYTWLNFSPLSRLQESLRPDLVNSNLNRTHSSSGELNGNVVRQCGQQQPSPASGQSWQTTASSGQQQQQQQLPAVPAGVSYNDLCFPKTSNYGSMKKKRNKDNVPIANKQPTRLAYVHS